MTKLATAALCLLALTGCQASVSASRSVDRSDLEKQVADGVTPDDPSASVDATCAGDLAAKVGATQDCHLDVGEETADVRLEVTKVDGGDVAFDTTPYLPAERLAESVKSGVVNQGYAVDSATCADELMGVVDEAVTCTLLPAATVGDVTVTVTSVEGLFIKFNIKAAS